jgi:hypothetical protein
MEVLDHIFQSLKPLKSKAQILLEFESGKSSIDRIKESIISIDTEMIEYNECDQNKFRYIKIILPAEDLQTVILKLAETGCNKILGLDAALQSSANNQYHKSSNQ